MEEKKYKYFKIFRHYFTIFSLIVAILTATVIPIFAWFYLGKTVAFYGPVSSPESIAIGAGHKDPNENNVDDARYLIFNELDVTNAEYVDYLFCVYGQAVGYYKLQLAYTTNNQFTYDLYYAKEIAPTDDDYNTYVPGDISYNPANAGAKSYTTHGETPETYYYVVDDDVPAENRPIAGTYLNKTVIVDEIDNEKSYVVADSSEHSSTYGEYSYLQFFAEPIYWQTTNSIAGNQNAFFVKYYILRVGLNGKNTNDRETDILCLSVRSSVVGDSQ